MKRDKLLLSDNEAVEEKSNMNQAMDNDIADLDHDIYLPISDGNHFYLR